MVSWPKCLSVLRALSRLTGNIIRQFEELDYHHVLQTARTHVVLWPKCLTASRAFLGPRNSTVFVPLGARSASWSKVMHSPPAARMRARAVSVNLRAHTAYHKIVGGRDVILVVECQRMVSVNLSLHEAHRSLYKAEWGRKSASDLQQVDVEM